MPDSKPVLGSDVLLFFEDRDRDTFLPGDRRLRRALRKAVARFHPNKQRLSGHEVGLLRLTRALELAGQTVHLNDFRMARRNPDFPVGLCGYPHVIESWTLPNPAVLGPGLYDHPKQNPTLMHDPRFRSYLAPCDWSRDMFATSWDRDDMRIWFSGVDLTEWPDTKTLSKDVDFLVYDKIRWNRDFYEPSLIQPILDELTRRGLRFEVIRYGRYTHAAYHSVLARSRAMIFLCEHESQGMACQEAMASNLPILAWDQGYWLDPNRPLWDDKPVPATSVPYFSDRCGESFVGFADFPSTLDRLLERIDWYSPRDFIGENVSFRESAERYMAAYREAGLPQRSGSRKLVLNPVSGVSVSV